MRIAILCTLLVSAAIAAGCGGKIVTESRGDLGGGGAGGDSGGAGTTTISGTNPKDCPSVSCSQDGTWCTCETTCMGPKLKAKCSFHEDGTLVCECHFNGGYMGTCAPSSGALCGLPDGCCEAYVP
ncbi:MAG: hypothetical protein U0441_26445 [Polyangiaceae bacterium]